MPGDDVRDIDWKASARSGHVLIKRFVSEKHHKILVVADTGRNTTGLAPSGEIKRQVAANVIGAMGLITLRRSDEIGMVFGDVRGCVDIRLRRGETHIEYLLHRFEQQTTNRQARSDIVTQLTWVARHYRHPLLIVVVSDEPDVDERLGDVLTRLSGRHDVMWAMVSDMPAVVSAEDEQDGFDVTSGTLRAQRRRGGTEGDRRVSTSAEAATTRTAFGVHDHCAVCRTRLSRAARMSGQG